MAEGLSNISTLNVGKMVDLLTNAYVSLIRNTQPFTNFPSVMLWGAPGVGKSQGVREIADRIGHETGKKVVITDVRLPERQRNRPGVAAPDSDKERVKWYLTTTSYPSAIIYP